MVFCDLKKRSTDKGVETLLVGRLVGCTGQFLLARL